MSLYFKETGPSAAPTIIFLHGVGTSGWMWWQQTEALADFHCIAVDLPGHGKSNQIQWDSLKTTADQIAEIIQAHATNRAAHIVGLSLGGYVALRLLQHHANLLDRVIVSGVTMAPMPNLFWLKPQLAIMSLFKDRSWFANSQIKSLGLPPQAQAAFKENLSLMSMQTYRTIFTEAAHFELPTSLKQVNNPTLVTAGGNETQIIIDAVAKIPKIMPNAVGLLAPGYGHGWNVEAPNLFNRMIRAWFHGEPLPAEMHEASA